MELQVGKCFGTMHRVMNSHHTQIHSHKHTRDNMA